MLIDVKSDKEFQAYLDEQEQRLHNRLFPILSAGIRLHLSKGAVHGQQYIIKRGEPALLAAYKRVYRDVYTNTFHSQKQARTGIGDFLSEQLSWLERRAARLIADIAQSVMGYIRNVIMDGVNKGLSNKEIARQITEDIPDISRNRAAVIARTETHSSATSAMDSTIQYQGIDIKTKTWWSVNDQRVRRSHADMHGEVVNYEDVFSNGLQFPGDPDGEPEEVINCRCVCLYNTESESEELTEKYNPDQPRVPAGSPEGGQWGQGGGSGAPTVQLGLYATDRGVREAQAAVNSIPTSHREALKDVPVKVIFSNVDFSKAAHADGMYLTSEKRIEVAQTFLLGSKNMAVDSIERTTVHELGHAYDHASGYRISGGLFGRKDVSQALAALTIKERARGAYYLQDPKELFSELYALTYSRDKGAKYFGMPYERAMEVWTKPVEYLRTLGPPSTKESS